MQRTLDYSDKWDKGAETRHNVIWIQSERLSVHLFLWTKINTLKDLLLVLLVDVPVLGRHQGNVERQCSTSYGNPQKRHQVTTSTFHVVTSVKLLNTIISGRQFWMVLLTPLSLRRKIGEYSNWYTSIPRSDKILR